MAKAKTGRKRKNVWSVPGLEKRVQDLVLEGALTKKNGEDAIIKTITAEFGEALAANGLRLTRTALGVRLHQLIWTKEVDGDLWRFHANGMMERFRELHSWIPEKGSYGVARRERALKGVTHSKSVAQFKAGMGRLTIENLPKGAEAFEFPVINFENPYVVSKAAEGCMPLINGALVGIKYPDIVRNTMRRALSDARKRGAVAVLVTNLFDLWTKKTAGFLAVYRARVAGLQINPDRFPAWYRKEVKDILSGKITDKMIYQTINERFEEILDGLHKISNRKDDQGPEYPGPFLYALGFKEEELIHAATYYEGRYRTIVEQNKIEAELNLASKRLAKAKRQQNVSQMNYWSAKVAHLGEKKSRAIITNHTGWQYEQLFRRTRAYVVKRLEETIPNCKVISQGSTCVKVSDKIIRLHVPATDGVTDGHLTDLGDNYGDDVFGDTLADMTIACPAYSLNHRLVGREDSRLETDGTRVPVTKFLRVAPSALDGEFLRSQFRDITKSSHPAIDLVRSPQFRGGVLLISWHNGLLHADNLPIEKLAQFDAPKDFSNFAWPYPRVKHITGYLNSDNHWGGVPKRFIWDRKGQMNLGVNEAFIEFGRRTGLLDDIPIHFTCEMDDPSDGNLWFNPTYRPHPRNMEIVHIQQYLKHLAGEIRRAAEKGDTKAVEQLTNEVNRVVLGQLDFKGEHFPFKQRGQVFKRHIEPNVDFYSAILRRFVKSGLKVTGLSKIGGSMSDDRDLGVHNFGTGNHSKSTLQGADLEGPWIARELQNQLGKEKFWQQYEVKHPGFLDEAIRGPHFGGETFGAGLIQTPNGIPWAIRMLGAPPRLSSWSDLGKAMVTSDLARGDDTYGLLKKHPIIVVMGDKHFYCEVDAKTMFYLICAAGVHTDTYGSAGGFPPNNTGVMTVSFPEGGPSEGPVIVRMFPHDFLRDWFANPKPFNWKKTLPIAA